MRGGWRQSGTTITIVSYAAITLALAALIGPTVAHAVDVWATDEEFTYGFLIVPIAIGIAWWRRHGLRNAIGRGNPQGLLLVAMAIVGLLVSRRTGINAIGGVAVTPLLIGIAAYLWGWRAARVLAFPSVFLLFGLGLYRGLLSSLGFALQDITAVGAEWTSHAIGLDVARDGLVLHSVSSAPPFAFIVAQACSGMSSLLSLLALAALLMYFTRGHLGGRAAVFASVLPLVLVANTARVTLVLLIASLFGQDAALGFFHGASSLVLFGLALGGLLLVSRTFGCELPVYATSAS